MFRPSVAALVAPLLLVACATRAGEASIHDAVVAPLAVLHAAPDRVAAEATGRAETTITVGAGAEAVTVTGTAAFDSDAEQMALSLDLADLAEGSDAGSTLDEPLEIVVDGAASYLRGGLVTALTGRSGWLVGTATDLGHGGLLGLPGLGTDPRPLLETLRTVETARAGGRDAVRGVATTRFDVRLDEAALAALGAGPGGGSGRVWIDADGLVRRLELTLPGGGLERAGLALAMEVFDYGAPAAIEVPSPAEVTALGGIRR